MNFLTFVIAIAGILDAVNSYIFFDEKVPLCYGMQCHNNGTLDDDTCMCNCKHGYTGLTCDTELQKSEWPEGQYALPTPLSGCPEDMLSRDWSAGYINLTMMDTIDNTSRHYWPDDTHILGPYHRRNIQLNFCTRSGNGNGTLPWPEGNYCIYKYGPQCPSGFDNGTITLQDYLINSGIFDGSLPEFELDANHKVTLTFCCRDDDDDSKPIILPTNMPFVLLKSLNSSSCQEVLNASATEEVFSFKRNQASVWNSTGSHPQLLEDSEFVNITFCYYKNENPPECYYESDKGASYRGRLNTTKWGPCNSWSESLTLDQRYHVDNDSNYCRRYHDYHKMPGCWIDGHRECDVPICDDPESNLKNIAFYKKMSTSPGHPFQTEKDSLGVCQQYQNEQLVVNGFTNEPMNYLISVPMIEPYFNIDLGFTHKVSAILIDRFIKISEDPGSYWRRMRVWVSDRQWDFLKYGALSCGDMVNAYKNDVFRFQCSSPLAGRFVTIQTLIHSDPDVIEDPSLNLQIRDIKVFGQETLCGRYLGLQSGEVLLSQIVTSSVMIGYHGNQSRVNGPGGWCALESDTMPWIKVHMLLPMIVEGVVIQGWLDDLGTLYFIDTFEVMYGYGESDMTYYTDSLGPKTFHVMPYEEHGLTQTFLFMKPFVARILSLKVRGNPACVKMELIVCKKRVERNCNKEAPIGWEEFPAHAQQKSYPISGEFNGTPDTCRVECISLNCTSILFTNNDDVCLLSEVGRQHPYNPLVTNGHENANYMERLCVKEAAINNCSFHLSEEGMITSPNYPSYYGDNLECIWDVYIKDAVALNIDIIDLDLYNVPRQNLLAGVISVTPQVCEDNITLQDVDFKSGSLYDTITGHEQKRERQTRIISVTNHITIKLKSCNKNTTVPHRGFALKITKSDCMHCQNGGVKLNQCSHALPDVVCKQRCGYFKTQYFPTPMIPSNQRPPAQNFKFLGHYNEYIRFQLVHLDISHEPGVHSITIKEKSISNKGTQTNILDRYQPYPVMYTQLSVNTEVAIRIKEQDDIRGALMKYEFVRPVNWQRSEIIYNSPDCAEGWVHFSGSCYNLTETPGGTYEDIRRYCIQKGADLTTITSMEESDAVNSYLISLSYLKDSEFLIGIKRYGDVNQFRWMDMSLAIFQNWRYDWFFPSIVKIEYLESMDNCVVLNITTNQNSANWEERKCGTDFYYALCERSLPTKSNEVPSYSPIKLNSTAVKPALNKRTLSCDNGEIVESTARCDGIKHCHDGSDEALFPIDISCDQDMFQCLDMTAYIHASRYCDLIIDCDDKSDEISCVYPACTASDFACSNGECIPKSARCDTKRDCLDGTDEIKCGALECSTKDGNYFRCRDKVTCIPRDQVCDGFGDCPGVAREDELDCEAMTIRATCDEWYQDGHTQSGTYKIDLGLDEPFLVECEFDISLQVVSTVFHHAMEASIPWEETSQASEYVVYKYVTSFLEDDGDKMSVIKALGMTCSQQVNIDCYQTPNLQVRQTNVRLYDFLTTTSCRLYTECKDEKGIPFCDIPGRCKCLLSEKDWLAKDRTAWYKDEFLITDMDNLPIRIIRSKAPEYPAQLRVQLYPFVCTQKMAEQFDSILCNNKVNVPKKYRCLKATNRYGSVLGCRDNTHLLHCESFECGPGWVKCSNSYCIPVEDVCNGVRDCQHGEDEQMCDSWTCPGQFRCRNSKTCIPLTKVCDGWRDCIRYGDDELYCNSTCPSVCTCEDGYTDCSGREITAQILKNISQLSRTIDLSHNDLYLQEHKIELDSFPYLGALVLSFCRISYLPEALFSSLPNLYSLDLSFNKLRGLTKNTFIGLEQLRTLNLFGNHLLSTIESGAFNGLGQLPVLDLHSLGLTWLSKDMFMGLSHLSILNVSYNAINEVGDNAFLFLPRLEVLDMSENSIASFGKSTFVGLKVLKHIFTDTFLFCCIRPSSVELGNCFPKPDEFSSCQDLMQNETLRGFLWLIGTFALLGNVLSLICRIVYDRKSLRTGYGILVTNLCLADMLMGVYLLIISTADSIFRGKYVWNDLSWRNSKICVFAGMLAFVSSECSVLILSLITIDRVKSIRFSSGLSMHSASLVCAFVWIFVTIFAVIPIIPLDVFKTYFGDSFYTISGVCLALPLTNKRLAGWAYSATIFIVFNFVCFLCIALGQMIVFHTVSRTKIMLESPDRRMEFIVAKRLSTIVVTDFLAWFPICVLGLHALNGHAVSGNVYTWIAVFVLPINSALNPIIYTFASIGNSEIGRKVLKGMGFQTEKFSTQTEVSQYLRNVHEVYRYGFFTLTQDRNHVTLKNYFRSTQEVTMCDVVYVSTKVSVAIKLIHELGLLIGRFNEDNILLILDKDGINSLIIKELPKAVTDDADTSRNIGDIGQLVGWMLKRYTVSRLARRHNSVRQI